MSGLFSEHYINSGQYLLDDGICLTEWEDVDGYPEYFVCKEGYVCRDNRILKPHRGDKQGHLNIRLSKNNKTKEEYVHRLVAKNFLRNPNNYPIVRHLDDNPENNDVNNLAWGTQKDNARDCRRNGNYHGVTAENREKGLRELRTPVIAKKLDSDKEIYFKGQGDAARKLGVQQSNIHKVLNGQRKHTCGYTFRYAERRQ